MYIFGNTKPCSGSISKFGVVGGFVWILLLQNLPCVWVYWWCNCNYTLSVCVHFIEVFLTSSAYLSVAAEGAVHFERKPSNQFQGFRSSRQCEGISVMYKFAP